MPPPLLPPDRHVERSKIEDYLLHPVKGRGKAAFFEAFGFSLADWQGLRDALLEHADTHPVAEAVVAVGHPLQCPRWPAHARRAPAAGRVQRLAG
jgi:hypothetical protein